MTNTPRVEVAAARLAGVGGVGADLAVPAVVVVRVAEEKIQPTEEEGKMRAHYVKIFRQAALAVIGLANLNAVAASSHTHRRMGSGASE